MLLLCLSVVRADPKPDSLVVSAAEIDFPPFSMVDEDGRASGFAVELMQASLKAMGRDVTFRTGIWSEVRSWLERGEVQALPLVGRTPERESIFDFTFPYMSLHGAIVVRKDEKGIQDLGDLVGRQVAVMKGDNAEEFLRREDRGINIHTTVTFEQALRELSEGKHDAVVSQRLVALRLIQETGLTNLRVINRPVEDFRQDFCFAVREGDRDMLALLNEGLALVMADGTYRYLHHKWFASLQLPWRPLVMVGGDHNYPPYEYLDEKGKPTGFIVELTRAIASEVGLDIEFRLGLWSEIVSGLEEGEIDVIQGMFYSPQRDLKFDFSQPHAANHYVSVVRKGEGAPPTTVQQLAERDIVVQRSDLIYDFLVENGLADRVSLVENQETLLRGVAEGKHDCALAVRMSALYLIEKYGWQNLELGRQPFLSPQYCYAVLNGRNALLAHFSQGLKILEENGEYRRIYEKWLGVYSDEPLSLLEALRYSALVLIPLLLILSGSLLWSWMLRKQVARRTAALRESEERYRLLFESNPHPMWVYDLETLAFLAVNDAALRHYGYSRDEFLNMTIRDIRPSEDIPVLLEDISRSKNGMGETGVWRHQKRNGTIIDVEITAHSISWSGRRARVVLAHDITERKRAEEALKESQRQLSTLMGSLPGMVYRCKNDPNWTMEFVSQGCYLLTGYKPEELIDNSRNSYAELIHPDDRQMVWDDVQAALKKKKPFQFVYRIITAAGEEKWVWERGQGIWGEKSQFVALEGFITDITERKRAEEELRKRLSYEHLLSEISSLAIKVADLDQFQNQCLQIMAEVLDVSRIYIFGHDPETDAMSNTFEWAARGIESQKKRLQQLPAGELPWWVKLMKENKVINYSNIEEIPAPKEKALLRSQDIKSILVVPLNVSGKYYGFIGFDECRSPRDWPEEDVQMLVSASRIISATIERQRAATERERLLSAIEQAGEMVVIADTEGIIQYVNPAFERITGYSREEVIGQNSRILKSGKHDEAFYRNLWETISSGKTWEGRFVNKRKDGTLYTEETTISPVRGASGRIVNYVAVKRDITEEMRLAAQLQQAQKMESIGRLAGGVAHDYNNMLSVITGYSEMAMAKLPVDSPLNSDLNEILKAANRSADITRQLLAFARKQTIAPKVLDLNETIEDTLKMLRRLIGEDIDLVWYPDGDLWSVKIDPAQVDQILANLCVNARDAIEGVGKITIETRNINFDEEYCAAHPGFVPGDFAMLAVSDDGHGMDKETLSKIFEPFFTTKGMGKGTGLGMATVYGIVKQNNGFINVYSEPQRGTQVKIYLPCYKGKITEIKPEDKVEISQGRGETVLLVEDDASILQLGKLMLESLGYKVLEAPTPIQALEISKGYGGKVDLLLTDVVMPGMNGRDLANQLKSLYPDLKVLFMSGYTANVIAHQNILEEGVNFIQKPFSVSDIANKVGEVLRREK